MHFCFLAPLTAATPVGIDLLVTDARGRLVTDLQPSEVTIQEDGQARGVEALRRAGSDGGRVFGLFLDEYHVDASASASIRAAVQAFLEHDLAPGDRVVVLKPLDSIVSIAFTSDHAAAAAAAAAFEGVRGDYRARTAFERTFLARSPDVVERTRAQVSWSALAALTDALAKADEGRKTLIVISQGPGAPAGTRGTWTGGATAVARVANSGGVAVYALDPVAEPAAGAADAGDTGAPLVDLADETNGRAVHGDLAAGLRSALADSTGYYWLSYEPTHDNDGRFHHVAVSVSRPQATVRARPGYWARSAAMERLVKEATAPPAVTPLLEASHASPLIDPWFGFARGPDGTTQVTLVWEPVSRVAGFSLTPRPRTPPRRASSLVVEAFGQDGTTPIFQGEVAPAVPGADAGTTPLQAVFDAPPGRVRLRMSVRGGPAGDEIDKDVRVITVRALDGAVTLGSAAVIRTFNAIDWRRAVSDPDAAPSASREFRRTERILIRFPVYAEGATQLSARLLGPDGGLLRDLNVAPGPGAAGTFQIDLPLANLAQGEYAVDIGAKAPAGEAHDRVQFRVNY